MSEQELELPKGWVETTLENIGHIVTGNTPSKKDPSNYGDFLPWVKPPQLDTGTIIHNTPEMLSEKGANSARILEKNSILISCIGELGKLGIAGTKLATNQQINSITCFNGIEYKFAYYFFQSPVFSLWLETNNSATVVAIINKGRFSKAPFIIPPLNEQKRIVTKIEELFSKIDSTKQSLEQTKLQLKLYRQSLLKSAFEGKLTEEWRKNNPNKSAQILLTKILEKRTKLYLQQMKDAKSKGLRKPRSKFLLEIPKLIQNEILPESWVVTNIDFIAFVTKLAGFEYTKFIRPEDSGEIPLIRAQNVKMGNFDDANTKFITKEISENLPRSQILGSEILMVFVGAGTGNVCLAPKGKQWHLAPNVAKIDVDGINRKYLFFYLQSSIGIKDNLSRIKASAQPSLSMQNIRTVNVNLPPLEEQEQIISQIEQGFSLIENTQNIVNSTLQTLQTMKMSVLKQAFEGKLVPQDPNDEPAHILLEKIKSTKEAQPTKKRRARNVK